MRKWLLGVVSAVALIFVVLALDTAGNGGGHAVLEAPAGVANLVSVVPRPVHTIRIGGQVFQVYNPRSLRAHLASGSSKIPMLSSLGATLEGFRSTEMCTPPSSCRMDTSSVPT